MTIYKVYKNMPFQFKAMKDRYWDMTVNKSIDADMAETIAMEPYAGVNGVINTNAAAPLIFVDGGLLPDYHKFKDFSGCLMPEGKNYLVSSEGYYNIVKVGEPRVDYVTGIVSGFSAVNYVRFGICIDHPYYDCIQKAYFDGDERVQTIWYSQNRPPIGMKDKKFGVDSGGWKLGATVFESGIYWFRAIFDNGTLKLYVLADEAENYTLDNLPAIADWAEELSLENVYNPFIGANFGLSGDRAEYWGGKMYLSGGLVMFENNEIRWQAKENLPKIYPGLLARNQPLEEEDTVCHLFYYDDKFCADVAEAKAGYRWCGEFNVPAQRVGQVFTQSFTVVNDPVFSYPYMSSFYHTRYLISSKAMPQGQYFPVNIKVVSRVVKKYKSGMQYIFCDESENNRGFGVNGDSWALTTTYDVRGVAATDNSIYWVQVIQMANEGTKLYYLEDNDETYTFDTLPELSEWSLGVSADDIIFDPTGQKLRIGNGYKYTDKYWAGRIDLVNTCVYHSISNAGTDVTWVRYWSPFS
ncbi:MAG: hypothetical protein NC218_10510 [Acetobacter sp.]|nr:hypothetical protein [Acetobacter sp.]